MNESVKPRDIYDDIVYNELIDASCVLEQIKSAAISANYYINNAEPPTKKDSAAGIVSDMLGIIKVLSETASDKLDIIDKKLAKYVVQDKWEE